jgi:hypothetical protein
MSIRVRHEAPLADVAGAYSAVGQMQGAAQGMEQNASIAKFLLGLKENQRQFNVNAGLRADDQSFERQRYANTLAATEANQLRQYQDRQYARQAELARTQIQGEYDLAQQQMQDDIRWQMQGAQSVDEQVVDMLKSANQMKLTPEGQRIRNEWMGQIRQVQSQRSTLRPDAFNAVMGQAMQRFQQLGLDAYAEHEPTPEEEVFGGMVPLNGQKIVPGQPLPPGKYRSVKGVRNGVKQYETIDIAAEEEPLTTADRFKRDMVPTPDGGFAIWNGEKKSWDYQAPQKKEAEKVEPKEPTLRSGDKVQLYQAVAKRLESQWERDHVHVTPATETADEKTTVDMPFEKYLDDNIAKEIARFNRAFGDPVEDDLTPSELREQSPPDLNMPEMQGDPDWYEGGEPQQDEREIITNAAGERAYVNPDGTVELID